ncbi:sequence-specific DNA binding, partial [Dipsacomyces acuminosporus]
TNYDHAFSRPLENSSAFSPADVKPELPPLINSNSSASYRTSIQFLTTPSSATPDVPMFYEPAPSPTSVPVSALLSPSEPPPPPPSAHDYHIANPISPVSIASPRRMTVSNIRSEGSHIGGNAKYGDDELTGMEGLMELSSSEHDQKPYNRIFDSHRVHSNSFSNASSTYTTNSHVGRSRGVSAGAAVVAAAAAAGSIAHPHAFNAISENNSSSASSDSANTYPVPPLFSLTINSNSTNRHNSNNNNPASGNTAGGVAGGHNAANSGAFSQHYHHHQHHQQHHHQQHNHQHSLPNPHFHGSQHNGGRSMGSPAAASAGIKASPDGIHSGSAKTGLRTFPATPDDTASSRKRSQSTDSVQNPSGNLPYLLGTANIRDRSYTYTQRQRTSDTPLFPILLYRIITNPQNESWIKWCDEGTAFKFSSSDNLLTCLQSAGLRAQNYHSIEKNLNDYRFTRLTDQRRKIPDPDGKLWWKFSHPQFHRDNPDVIVNIQRRRRTNPTPVSPQPPIIPHQPPPPPPPQYASSVSSQHHSHQQHQIQQQQHSLQSKSQYPHQNHDNWM